MLLHHALHGTFEIAHHRSQPPRSPRFARLARRPRGYGIQLHRKQTNTGGKRNRAGTATLPADFFDAAVLQIMLRMVPLKWRIAEVGRLARLASLGSLGGLVGDASWLPTPSRRARGADD